MAKKLQKR